MNGTPNEYDLQSVYNGDGFVGIITELSQIYLAIYDTNAQPCVYTDIKNTDITYNPILFKFPNEDKQRNRVKSKGIR